MLGKVRGTLDGSPLDKDFQKTKTATTGGNESLDLIGKDAYATEGWCVSNRGWQATLTFSTLGSQQVKILNRDGKEIKQAKAGETVIIELKAALNMDWNLGEKGQILLTVNGKSPNTIEVNETGENTGVFRASYTIPAACRSLQVSYGTMGFTKKADLVVR
jgi:hypothetical protein